MDSLVGHLITVPSTLQGTYSLIVISSSHLDFTTLFLMVILNFTILSTGERKASEFRNIAKRVGKNIIQLSSYVFNSFHNLSLLFNYLLAVVPGAARVNLLPAEHLKNVSFSF